MKIHRVDQGSGDWFKLRMGIPTSSQFHKIVTPKGALSTQSTKYMYRLIAERLLNESMDAALSVEWVERGRELEPQAVQHYQFQYDIELEPGGFITTDDGRIGCSPDRLVKGKSEGIEIKCPAAFTQIQYLLEGPRDDYVPQVQGHLLVSDFDVVRFYAWHPQMPSCHVITRPDPDYLSVLRSALSAFCDTLDKATERARSLGAYAANTSFQTPLDESVPAAEPLTIVIPE